MLYYRINTQMFGLDSGWVLFFYIDKSFYSFNKDDYIQVIWRNRKKYPIFGFQLVYKKMNSYNA